LNQASIRYNLSSKEFSDESIDAMMKYNWPGNFRELLSVVERAVILSEGNVITENDLFLESRKRKKSIQEMEKELICEMLIDTNHNMSETATLLGMSKRNLEKKIKTYEIEVIEDEKV
jgi:two-component system NtrC family response regulator